MIVKEKRLYRFISIILKKLGYTDEQVAAMIAAGEAQPMDPALKD